MAPKTAIIIYSLYQHITKLATSAQTGIEAAGGVSKIFQVPETLPASLLTKLGAPPKPDFPIADLETLREYDAFLFGVPTRYGTFPAQFKSFWDGTGSLFANGELIGKPAGVFVSTASVGGGQETTAINTLSTLAHHGMIYVPLGFSHPRIGDLTEVHGGSPWGAGTFAGPDGKREVSPLELEIAKHQGTHFFNQISKLK